jgi:hypothetical protein
LGAPARAQFDPRVILSGMIQQLQQGRPDPSWYGPQLWQLMAMETGGSGVYPVLAALGQVRDIAVLQQNPLPGGFVYVMTAQHVGGVSHWMLGIGTASRRIEYAQAQFVPEGGLPGGPPGRAPAPPPGGLGNPAPQPAPPGPSNAPPRLAPPTSQSEACRRFPNLC